ARSDGIGYKVLVRRPRRGFRCRRFPWEGGPMGASRLVFWGVGAALVGGLLTPGVAGADVAVNCDNQQILQTKIDNAAPGATVLIKGTCIGQFTVAKNLTLQGNPTATLNADSSGRVLQVNGERTIHLRSLVVTKGVADSGGGVAMT